MAYHATTRWSSGIPRDHSRSQVEKVNEINHLGEGGEKVGELRPNVRGPPSFAMKAEREWGDYGGLAIYQHSRLYRPCILYRTVYMERMTKMDDWINRPENKGRSAYLRAGVNGYDRGYEAALEDYQRQVLDALNTPLFTAAKDDSGKLTTAACVIASRAAIRALKKDNERSDHDEQTT